MHSHLNSALFRELFKTFQLRSLCRNNRKISLRILNEIVLISYPICVKKNTIYNVVSNYLNCI